MSDLDLMLERLDLERHAANVAGLILEEDGSAKADAYAIEHRLAARTRALKAAGGLR